MIHSYSKNPPNIKWRIFNHAIFDWGDTKYSFHYNSIPSQKEEKINFSLNHERRKHRLATVLS